MPGGQQPIPVLHLITTLDVGGAEKMLAKLLSGMDTKAFSNHVVSLTKMGRVGQEIASRGIPVYSLNMPNGSLTAAGLIRLWRLLRSIRPKILQTWLYHADLLGLVFGKIAGIRCICWNVRCSYRDLSEYSRSTKWVIELCKLSSFFPRTIIANSEKGLSYHVDLGYKAKHWKVIPNGFDLETFTPDKESVKRVRGQLGLLAKENKGGDRGGKKRDTSDGEVLLIGLVARYAPIKDHPTFLKAACLLLEEGKDIHFVLAGREITWENKRLVTQIPRKWKDRFHLLGECDNMSEITAALDIASMVSYGEGFPNVICEAMACGVPCAVTDVGDAARIVGDTGLVVPPRDPEALAAAWNKLIGRGPGGRARLGLDARERVKAYFALPHVIREYETLYRALAAA